MQHTQKRVFAAAALRPKTPAMMNYRYKRFWLIIGLPNIKGIKWANMCASNK